jgi:hypothetical protein
VKVGRAGEEHTVHSHTVAKFFNSISSGLENQNFVSFIGNVCSFNTGCKKSISKAESALTFGHNQLFEDLSRPESKLFLLVQISSVEKVG